VLSAVSSEADSVDAAQVVGQGDHAHTGGRHEAGERAETTGAAVVPEQDVLARRTRH